MKKHVHKIVGVEENSIAEELGIEAGDVLLKVNDKYIYDVLDFRYEQNDEYVVLLIRKSDGEEWELEIEKDYSEDLGIIFEQPLMDCYNSCRNKCIFCFIDQMPKGMRDTLYFKDDDARLSFLQGNYITLTNMKDDDFERIIGYRLSPINISIQTMNPELRCKMLNNRFAGEALKRLDRLNEVGIQMNSQIVLCKGINDGDELERSIHDLTQYIPNMSSLSVVPSGLTDHRDGLYELAPFEKEDAIKVLEIIHKWQKICMDNFGTRFVYASDEWYILAGIPIPDGDYYEGYEQLENGVGMIRSFADDFEVAVSELVDKHNFNDLIDTKKKFTFVTGVLFSSYLDDCLKKLNEVYPCFEYEIVTVLNDFFGHKITVAGLITGQDIINQLKDRELGDFIIIPDTMLKADEDIFLDDVTVREIESALQKKVHIVKSSGDVLVDFIINNTV